MADTLIRTKYVISLGGQFKMECTVESSATDVDSIAAYVSHHFENSMADKGVTITIDDTCIRTLNGSEPPC